MNIMSLFAGKGPNLTSILKMITPFLTDSNIAQAVPELRKVLEQQQAAAGGKLVLSAELSDDAQQLNVRVWIRDPQTNTLSVHKEFDLFALTQDQLKTFIDGIAKQQ